MQLDSLAYEHDINRLRKECEQKDLTIMELSTSLNTSQVLGSKVKFSTLKFIFMFQVLCIILLFLFF